MKRWLIFLGRTIYHCGPEETAERIDAAGEDVAELMAEFFIEPWGEWRSDLGVARITSTLANVFGGKKGGGHFTIDEFMPQFAKEAAKRAERNPALDAKKAREKSAGLMAKLKAYTMLRKGEIKERSEVKK